MKKSELKENIVNINKLLRSDNYQAGIELIKTLDDQEIRKDTAKGVAARIKKMLKQRDYDAIDTVIKLARDLDEPAVFETLLEGCSIDISGKLVRNKVFSGTEPAQPFLDYALWNLITYAPQNTLMDDSLKSKNKTIYFLDLDSINKYHDIFINLSSLTSLEVNNCWNLLNLDFLENLTNLTNIKLIFCGKLKISDGKANFPHITSLSLTSIEHFKNLDWLVKFPNLKYLHLSYIDSLNNIDGLINCKNLNNIGLYCNRDILENVNILTNFPNLNYLHFYDCDAVQPKPSKDKMTTREEVAAYQEEITKSMKC
jgi:hypothetical protein